MKIDVHFKDIKKEIINTLSKAKTDINVAMAWLTDEDIIRALTKKQEGGVQVGIVISDSKENFRNTSKFKDLIKNGGKIHIATKNFLHHKFCIIDDNVLINGSYNWSYYAKNNEENILLILLDTDSKEDAVLFLKFKTKFNYFCDKISYYVEDFAAFQAYSKYSKDSNKIMSELDEKEIELRKEFEEDVKKSSDKAVELGIPPSPFFFDRMKSDGGGVEFVKRILNDEIYSGDMKSGFRKLEQYIPHKVELSLEYLVSRTKYESLFSPEEVEYCKKLMSKYGL